MYFQISKVFCKDRKITLVNLPDIHAADDDNLKYILHTNF